MIAKLVLLLRPVVEPLLKLRMGAPHLPEGQREVRHLKPSAAYLAYRYLAVALAAAGALVAVAAVSLALFLRVGTAAGLVTGGALAALVLAAATFALIEARLDWELCDYLLGDRSLRVREGALVQREITLSYANVQNVEIAQGPLERLFGFASLRVTTAGGSGGGGDKRAASDDAHHALLVGLEDAAALRALILECLRRDPGAGLGDADDGTPRASTGHASRAAALEEVRDAARALHAAAVRTRARPPQ